MTTEGGGAAPLDGRHHLELGQAQVPGLGRPVGRPGSAEDVGDLQRGSNAESAGCALSFHQQREALQRPGDGADRLGRDPGVERGGVELGVSEQHLDDADVDILFQEVGGKAVA